VLLLARESIGVGDTGNMQRDAPRARAN